MAKSRIDDLSLHFGGLTVLDENFLRGRIGRTLGADRAERRRQDQRAQLHRRHLSRAGLHTPGFVAEIGGKPPHAIARLGIGRTFQHGELFPDMSVLDNL